MPGRTPKSENRASLAKKTKKTSKNKFAFSEHSFTRYAAARWQDSMSPEQKSIFFLKLPTIIFCSFLDNVEIIIIKSVSEKKSRGH